MSVSDKIKNRGAHGDSSFMLGRLRPSSENPTAFMRLGCQFGFAECDKGYITVKVEI